MLSYKKSLTKQTQSHHAFLFNNFGSTLDSSNHYNNNKLDQLENVSRSKSNSTLFPHQYDNIFSKRQQYQQRVGWNIYVLIFISKYHISKRRFYLSIFLSSIVLYFYISILLYIYLSMQLLLDHPNKFILLLCETVTATEIDNVAKSLVFVHQYHERTVALLQMVISRELQVAGNRIYISMYVCICISASIYFDL